jgi:cell division transport system permease protein
MSGFVAGVVAVLMFVSGIAGTGAAYIDALLASWTASVTGTLTVQIAPDARSGQNQVEAVLTAVRGLPEVARAEVLAAERVRDLLKPWLGDERLIADLPLPTLIDVHLRTPTAEGAAKVAAAVTAAAPEAAIDDHRVWLSRVVDFARGLGAIAVALIALAVAATTFTVILATRASLTEHMQVIEVLHLIGAHDGYIAGQYARRAVRQVVWGTVIGLTAFAPALAAVAWLAGRVDESILPRVSLTLEYWAALAALPILAGAIAYIAALVTVRRALRSMV